MRELSEYKVEIFRRGKEKIRRRRNRRIAFGVTVPLVLCLICLPLLPDLAPKVVSGNDKHISNNAGAPKAECMEVPAMGVCCIYVNQNGKQWQIDDSAAVTEVAALLGECLLPTADQENSAVNNSAPSCADKESVLDNSDALADCVLPLEDTVTVCTPEGLVLHCNLQDGSVYEEGTGRQGVASADVLEQLKKLLQKSE